MKGCGCYLSKCETSLITNECIGAAEHELTDSGWID